MSSSRMKVLYITGPGRGGSTILGAILGALESFFFVGEINSIWKYYLMEDRLCGCGVSASECEVWRSVLAEAFGDLGQIDVYAMDRLRRYRIPIRYIPETLVTRSAARRTRLQASLKNQLDHLERLYRAIQSITGCRVIVDSSKRPAYGHLLGLIPTIDLYVVHLVRDARAVAYSWLRKKVQQSVGSDLMYMGQYAPATSAVGWNRRNILVEMFLRHSPKRYLMLRYEDFVNRPQAAIKYMLDLIQEEPAQLPFVAEHSVQLTANHSVRGNPNRFETGLIELRLDEEWKEKMKPRDRNTVTALTWPLLIRYGYLGRKGV